MSIQRFDYLIVGGGAAGAVLAARLSERSSFNVALLEAGPDTPPGEEPADILDAYPIVAYFNRSYHWQDLGVYLDTPKNADTPPRRYEQAKVMGGGTSINGQFAFRGLPSDFASWEERGAKGWGWDEVLPYYRKLETDLDFGKSPLHGDSGPMPLRRIPRAKWSPFGEAAAQALEAQGVPDIGDHNGDPVDGFFPMTTNNNVDGERVSTARAYLTKEVRARKNLTIMPLTEVTSLRFDGQRAIGVKARRNGQEILLDAGEVIVCAGALQSPTLLHKAGIGNASQLRASGVEVLADRPGVGLNLQDHPMVAFAGYLPKRSRLPKSQRRHIQMGYRYSSDIANTPGGDMFMLASNRAAWHPIGRQLASILVCVNRPFSTGEITLERRNGELKSNINFRQLSDERDLKRLEDGMHRLWRLVNHPSMKGVVERVFPATFSDRVRKLGAVTNQNWLITFMGSMVMDLGDFPRKMMIENVIAPNQDAAQMMQSNNALRDWIIDNACGSWHASGTCRIGDPDDKYAVVDSSCRVIGVEGLRVVDASIMPSVISGNTMLTTVMAGEKIADAIKAAA
ncbi:NAD(P)-binding protein [Aureimonas fodinaquatilis]|uniref:NAD(P)-binding protein n=1 Tax=Aureimonas fodinaquatilis TaxID=2565783 RepID=A0A5B0DTQ5_9HYPH|nr:GMC family oxidoreductase N-terminal domain-containing protein [Aureimonas fodinaquatilis]KAA0969362.1 NAD(P)-binding protein [Aureimonas fodinaquatilis]